MSEIKTDSDIDPNEAEEAAPGGEEIEVQIKSPEAEAESGEEPADEAAEPAPESDSGAETGDDKSEPEEERDPLQKLEAEVEVWKDRAMRRQAELENYRKRSAREKSEAIRYANSGLLGDLFPILDNFEMGLKAASAEKESVIGKGMEMVHQQMHDFLENCGVTVIDPEGEPFDPNVHEAVSQEASDEVPEGSILAVVRKGYRLHDRLLRAANVVVSTGPESSGGEKEE